LRHANSKSDGKSVGHPDRDTVTVRVANGDAYGNTYRHGHRHADGHSDRGSERNADRDPNCDSDGLTNASADSVAERDTVADAGH
jgi:hypothetical protein